MDAQSVEPSANDLVRAVDKIAAEKSRIAGWKPYAWEVVEGGMIVTGSVPVGVFVRGPRKGHTKWDPRHPTTRRVVVAASEIKTDQRI